jgi:hypothetical protein
MNAEHVYRISSSGWVHCHGDQLEEVPAWPRLSHSALAVFDLDDAFSDVWRFEGNAEYAQALIEKRVRTEGLVEGAAHIVVHRLVKLAGGFQVFFSTLPLDLWQRCTQWSKEQTDHCLVMMASGLLCHNVGNDQARLMLSQRRVTCFAQSQTGMVFGVTQALGSGPAALASAAQVLMSKQSALLSHLRPDAVEWGVLWSTGAEDGDICLEAVRSVLGGDPVAMPEQKLVLNGEQVRTALSALARAATGQHALNPPLERLAWRAERWVGPVTMVTVLVGLALAIAGVLFDQMAAHQRATALSQRSELTTLQDRIQAVATMAAPQNLLPAADFALALDAGARYDPVSFLALLRGASSKDVQIQRVRLEAHVGQAHSRAFRVDGVVAPGASAAMKRWVSAMIVAGWTLKAVDPALAIPGAFSYELVAAAPESGNVKP